MLQSISYNTVLLTLVLPRLPSLCLSLFPFPFIRLTRMLMTRMIQRIGHKVSTAENGAVALKLIKERHLSNSKGPQYDCIFLDK